MFFFFFAFSRDSYLVSLSLFFLSSRTVYNLFEKPKKKNAQIFFSAVVVSSFAHLSKQSRISSLCPLCVRVFSLLIVIQFFCLYISADFCLIHLYVYINMKKTKLMKMMKKKRAKATKLFFLRYFKLLHLIILYDVFLCKCCFSFHVFVWMYAKRKKRF